MSTPVVNPYTQILGLTGLGLNNGSVYIGVPDGDPVTDPQAVYWDAALTVPASQPLSVMGGYLMRSGSPAQAYTTGSYSVRANDKNGVQVFYIAQTGEPFLGPYYPEWYGAAGDYSRLDTSAVQAAIDACSAAGGGTVQLTGRYLVGNITAPASVLLQGVGTYPLAQQSAAYVNYYAYPSALRLTSGASVTVQAGGAMDRLLVIRDGLPLITSVGQATTANLNALLAAFSGTGITAPDPEVKLTNLLVLGHALGLDISTKASGNRGRAIVQNVWGDNVGGLRLSRAFDVCRLDNIHFWPFLTNDATGPSGDGAANWRTGAGFYISTGDDWSVMDGCFAYGYGSDGTQANFVFDGANSIRLTNFGSDGPGDLSTTYGIKVINASTSLVFTNGIIAAGLGTGVLVNTTATAGIAATVKISKTSIAGNVAGVVVQAGNILADGNSFGSCTIAYHITAASSLSSMSNDEFQSGTVPTPYAINSATLNTVFIDGWTLPFSYTPTITGGAGATFTGIVAEGRLSLNRRCSFKLGWTVSAGGAGGAITYTLPATSENAVLDQYFAGAIAGGAALKASVPANSAIASLAKYDNTTACVTGNVINVSGEYDTAA